MTDYKILSRKATIVNVHGMHARPAAMIAKAAQDAVAIIWVGAGDNRADASSIIDILSLGCSRGCEVTLEAENEDDLPILDSIKEIIDKGFGEDSDG